MNILQLPRRLRKSLFHLDSQRLGLPTLIVLVLLDLFVLVSLMTGLHQHSAQLTSPQEYIPGYCRDAVIHKTWNDANQLEQLAQLVNQHNEKSTYHHPRSPDRHPLCQALEDRLDRVRQDSRVSDTLKDWTTKLEEIRLIDARLGNLTPSYRTDLLETVAGLDRPEPSTEISTRINSDQAALETLVRQAAALETSLDANEAVAATLSQLGSYTLEDRARLTQALRTANLWYPVKRVGMEFLFLAPAIAIFYFWHARSLVRNRPFQQLLSAHLLVVAMIPALFKLGELLHDIIPRHLLENLISLLQSLGLVAIWHYLVIAVSVLMAAALIYLFQKKLFSREREMTRRISKGQCQGCGLHIEDAVCTHCGFAQYTPCNSCGEQTYVSGAFCRHCGAVQETDASWIRAS